MSNVHEWYGEIAKEYDDRCPACGGLCGAHAGSCPHHIANRAAPQPSEPDTPEGGDVATKLASELRGISWLTDDPAIRAICSDVADVLASLRRDLDEARRERDEARNVLQYAGNEAGRMDAEHRRLREALEKLADAVGRRAIPSWLAPAYDKALRALSPSTESEASDER